MTDIYRVSKHAIDRYQERVEPCTDAQAWDRIKHAAEISRLPSTKQLRWFTSRGGGRRDSASSNGIIRYCPIESLLLLCRRMSDGALVVVTIIRCPPDTALAIRRNRLARRHEVAE
jgi:hypothetical protein